MIAYVHGGGFLVYLAHYVLARIIFDSIASAGGTLAVAVLAIAAVVFLVRRRRCR